MALVHEYLGYNRFGLRYTTTKEMRQRRERFLEHDLSRKKDMQQSHQDGKAIEWIFAFLALTIAHQKEKETLFRNLGMFKKAVNEKFMNGR